MSSQEPKPRVIVICGPTGIGKTSVGITLANEYDGEIISADSMQIYRRMDIGTAKPTAAELNAARHHLVDICEPDEPFDAAAFVQQRAYETGHPYEPEPIFVVLDLQADYLQAIGAIGNPVEPEPDTGP